MVNFKNIIFTFLAGKISFHCQEHKADFHDNAKM